MSVLTVSFLGSPLVLSDGAPVTFRTRKTLALFAYLLVTGTTHTRTALCGLFWPDREEADARASLRTALAALRRAAGEGRVRVDGDLIGIVPDDRIHADFLALEAALRRRQSPVEELERAAALPRGPFLDGITIGNAEAFEDWLLVQRAYWERKADELFDLAIEKLLEEREGARARQTASVWVAARPDCDEAYRRLMEAHVACGELEAALRVYASAVKVIGARLGIGLAPQTEALAERIRRDRGQHASGRLVSRGGRGQLAVPMVGRAGPISRLVEAFHRNRQGLTEIVLIEGPAGIGKTRLMTEFIEWAEANGASVLLGRTFETGALPYAPLVEAMRRGLERERSPDDLIADVWLTELARLLPELRERYPDLPRPEEDDMLARARMLEAVVRVGEALAARRPLVLALDDLQWADEGSHDLLHYLVRSWTARRTPVTILATVRSETRGDPDFARRLSSLKRSTSVERIPLRALMLDETVELIRSLMGSPDQSESVLSLAVPLQRETGGHLFLLVESLKLLHSRGLLAAHGGWDDTVRVDPQSQLPYASELRAAVLSSVESLLQARMATLNEPARAVLATAAVLEHAITFDALTDVSELGESEMVTTLDALIAAGLLVEVPASAGDATEGFYAFGHDTVRQAVYASLSQARRMLLHRRALGTRSRDGGRRRPLRAADLAHHADAAGLPVEAFRWSLAAGDDAMRLFAVRDALGHYERARHALQEVLPEAVGREITPSDVEHCYLQLARAYELLNRVNHAANTYEDLRQFALAAGRTATLCRALNHLAMAEVQEGMNIHAATALLEAATDLARGLDDRLLLAETEWNNAQIGIYSFDTERSLRHGTGALRLARDIAAPDLIGQSLNVLAFAHAHTGHWPQVERLATDAMDTFRAIGSKAMELDSLGLLVGSFTFRGRAAEAVQLGRRGMVLAQEIESMAGLQALAFNLAPALLDIGEYDECYRLLSRCVTLAREMSFTPFQIFSLAHLGAMERLLGHPERARELHRDAVEVSSHLDWTPFPELAITELCADEAVLGNWDEAYRLARESLDMRTYRFAYTSQERWFQIEALLRAGKMARAEEDVALLRQQFPDNPRWTISILRSAAVIMDARGHGGRAVALLEEAVQIAASLELPGQLWQLLRALAYTRDRIDDDARADEARLRASGILRDLAARSHESYVRASLARLLGQPAHPAG